MKTVQFVNANDMKTLEQYGASLLSSMISLRTLEQFHLSALSQGLLDSDETETAQTICWEIKRLLALYKKQLENVLERTAIDESTIIKNLQAMMPDIKIPKKRNQRKDKPNPVGD